MQHEIARVVPVVPAQARQFHESLYPAKLTRSSGFKSYCWPSAFMDSEPPNYRLQLARYGPRCDICEFYDNAQVRCRKYSCPVKPNMECDSWKRNPDIPVRAV